MKALLSLSPTRTLSFHLPFSSSSEVCLSPNNSCVKRKLSFGRVSENMTTGRPPIANKFRMHENLYTACNTVYHSTNIILVFTTQRICILGERRISSPQTHPPLPRSLFYCNSLTLSRPLFVTIFVTLSIYHFASLSPQTPPSPPPVSCSL